MRISDWSSDVCSSDLLPLLVFVVTVLAVPLAKVNPRQGRFLKLLPAILLYMTYLALLIAVRGALDKGRIPMALGLWWVHGLFLAIGLLMLYWRSEEHTSELQSLMRISYAVFCLHKNNNRGKNE